MKKILIISYYWIPSGGSGVQRWVKFTKYLRDYGWEPIIYTPENPEYPVLDDSFVKDIPTDIKVIKTPIWEPYSIYRKLTNKKDEPINAGFISENKSKNWKENLSVWIRGNFLIPDPRSFWIRPSVKYLTEYLKTNPVDAIITTGPPHSMHFIGLGLKKAFPNIPWVTDFRDPWTNIYYYKDLKLSKIADRIHHKLEKKIVQKSDLLLVVSNGMKQEFSYLNPKRIQVLTNGFDTDDQPAESITLDSKFSISYIGLLTENQNPTVLWEVLEDLCKEDIEFKKDLQIQLIGKIDYSAIESIKNHNLFEQLIQSAYIPHNEAIARQRSSQVLLLLLINKEGNFKGVLTGKLFEYLAAKRPVLGFGTTDSDAAKVLSDVGAGKMIAFTDKAETKKVILEYYSQYKSDSLTINSSSVEKYSRKSLTEEFVNLLNAL